MTRAGFRLPIAFVLALFLRLSARAEEPARVETFSPQGAARGVRQAAARFSEPVVALDNADVPIPAPFDVVCPTKGRGRWTDPKNWVYDFEEDLPAGIVCEFSLRAGLTTLSGRTVGAQRLFFFSTGGPSILQSAPYEGNAVREDQPFLLYLDAEADEASVLGHVAFSIDGAQDPVEVAILKGDDRARVIRSARYANDGPSLLVIRAVRPFPEGARIHLVWGTGVRSSWGIPTEGPQSVSYTVRGPFAARFTCGRGQEGGKCDPRLPMEIRFSAPVPAEFLRKIALRGPGTAAYEPEVSAGDRQDDPGHAATAIFRGPFPGASAFTITVPPEIRDDAGRALRNIDRFPLAVRTGELSPR